MLWRNGNTQSDAGSWENEAGNSRLFGAGKGADKELDQSVQSETNQPINAEPEEMSGQRTLLVSL